MHDVDAAVFLVSLVSMSVSVSLLLGLLILFKERLLTRYRARTLYLLGLLLTVLLLCPWRPALLAPKVTLLNVQTAEKAPITQGVSLPAVQSVQASNGAGSPAASSQAAGALAESTAFQPTDDVQKAAASAQHQAFNIPWACTLLAVWAAGALIGLLIQMTRHTRFLRLIRRWQSPVSQDVQAALTEQCLKLGIKPPPAYITPCVQSPTVAGLMHPIILLPAIDFERQQLSLMLTHELIHLKHGHLWGKALGCLTLAVHWFNPIMPFLMREMGALCEMACDETVLTRNATEQQGAYVDAIVNAALFTHAVQTPLCSPMNGGMKQMKHIKQRIELLTPFKPRKAGIGFIACMLLLALFTGSVLADKTTDSTFTLPEESWPTQASFFMPQADYDLLMSMQTPGWEELSTEAYAKQIMPQLPQLTAIFDVREPENRFMRHLKYSVSEAGTPSSDSHQMRWNTSFWCYDPRGMVLLDYELNWRYSGTDKLTCGERSKLLDDALVFADRAARTLNVAKIQEMGSTNDASTALAAQLNESAKELGENALTIWFTNVGVDTSISKPSPAIQAQRELLSALTPEGYRDQTAKDYQVFLQENVGDYNTKMRDAIENIVHKTVYEAYMEMHGLSYYLGGTAADFTLMPAWTMRGMIYNRYRLDWTTVGPSSITVGQRHDAICKMIDGLRDEATYAAWEAEDWESFDKTLKERLPALAKANSTPALTFTISKVALQLAPLATGKYVHSSPQNALKAFMSAAYIQDTALMATILPPIEANANSAEALATREAKLKHFAQMYPSSRTIGEPRKDPQKDDVMIIDLTFDKFNADGMGIGVVTRQVRFTQIDGKWYLLLESLQL